MSQYCDHFDVAMAEGDGFGVLFNDADNFAGFAQNVTALSIKGYYNTLADLQAAITGPAVGDSYGVGTEAPFDVYVYSPTGWVNNGSPMMGVPGERGEKGDRGDPGTGLTIKGTYATAAQLPATGEAGDAYGVGASEPYDIYIRQPNGTYINYGQLQGPPGADGQPGKDGQPGPAGPPGSDASVTTANITAALGYTPANPADIPDEVKTALTTGPEWTGAEQVAALAKLGGAKVDMLWENVSPTTEIAAQTLTLDSSSYDAIMIIYREVTNNSAQVSVIGEKAAKAILGTDFFAMSLKTFSNATGTSAVFTNYRSVRVYDQQIEISDCTHKNIVAASTTVANNYIIPIYIYGLKY